MTDTKLGRAEGEALRALIEAATLDYGETSGRVHYVLPHQDAALIDVLRKKASAITDTIADAAEFEAALEKIRDATPSRIEWARGIASQALAARRKP